MTTEDVAANDFNLNISLATSSRSSTNRASRSRRPSPTSGGELSEAYAAEDRLKELLVTAGLMS